MTSQEQRVEEDNSDRLRILIEESGFTQNEASPDSIEVKHEKWPCER
jgi:hypothetical protein